MTIKLPVNKSAKKRKYKFHLPKGQYLRNFAEYKEDMPEEAYSILSNGGTCASVKAYLQLCDQTFEDWMKDPDKPKFKEAVRAGKRMSREWHLNYMTRNLENRNYNERAHGRLLKMAWNVPEDPYVSFKELNEASTAAEKSKAVLKAVSEGRLTPSQGSQISDNILKSVAADEATNVKQDIAMLKEKLGKD